MKYFTSTCIVMIIVTNYSPKRDVEGLEAGCFPWPMEKLKMYGALKKNMPMK